MSFFEPSFFFTENRFGVERLLRGPEGAVTRHFVKRGLLVKAAAETQIRRTVKHGTGRLADSIFIRVSAVPGGHGLIIGSNSPHSLFVHQGTRPHVITPRSATVLRWMGNGGTVVFAKLVHHPGSAPIHFLTDNLPIVVGRAPVESVVVSRTATGGLYTRTGRL